MRESPCSLVHVICEMSLTEKKLREFLKEHPENENFAQLKETSPKLYKWIRTEIIAYCNNYHYSV